MSLITCSDVSLSYGQKTVVDSVNFHLEVGNYLAVIGENGCGKSTLLKGLLRLKKLSRGTIRFSEETGLRGIGYLPQRQEEQKDFPASVMEVVQSGRLSHLHFPFLYRARDRKDIADIMKALSISHLSDRCLHDLSGGQRQRVLLARALAAGNRILFLDEPVTGLDTQSTDILYSLLQVLREKWHLTIIMVSHDLPRVLKEADTVLYLSRGKQRFFGSTDDFLRSRYSERKEAPLHGTVF